jgi:hypothetical protein
VFSVIFEVLPNKANWDDYLGNAKMLRPELEQVEGFVDNIRYKSVTRDGWLLSCRAGGTRSPSCVGDPHAPPRGPAEGPRRNPGRLPPPCGADHCGRPAPGRRCTLAEQRLDETEVGEGTAVTLINATRPPEWKGTNNPYDCTEWLGLNPWAADSTSWDIFFPKDNARSRRVRVIRDYGKYDRREAPQYYADASGAETIHA